MKKIFTALLALAILVTPTSASALANENNSQNPNGLFRISHTEAFNGFLWPTPGPFTLETETPAPEPETPPEPVIYTVVSGDNLSEIAKAHDINWLRIWAANENIKHPDVISIGQKLTIPDDTEVLADRELPPVVTLPVETPRATTGRASATPAPQVSYSGGNTYSYGYCTWYVKNRRGASLPNGLGNANTWYSRAQAMGMAIGTMPRVGAVGATTRGALGHVVYVEAVHSNGTITVSEMNYNGWAVQSTRTTSATEFVYIY